MMLIWIVFFGEILYSLPVSKPEEIMATRLSTIQRVTGETAIDLSINLDGTGKARIATGHPFFDHMLNLMAKHSLMDMEIEARGDLEVDAHHTVEDVGISIGECIQKALGDKKGIYRYAHVYVPMDETLVRVVVDLSNRPFLEFRVPANTKDAPNLPITLVEEFARAIANNLRCNLHIEVLYGRDGHHVAEAIFKGMARALRFAMEIDTRVADQIPSTKGLL